MSTETSATPSSPETSPPDGALSGESLPGESSPEASSSGDLLPDASGENPDAAEHPDAKEEEPLELPGVAGEMYAQCKTALRAFFRLRELSEDMRILSLNAELAAGRAGSAGVAVRALTQYTRQLVSQLNRVQEDMNTLQSDTEAMVTPKNPNGEAGATAHADAEANAETPAVPSHTAENPADHDEDNDHLIGEMAERAKHISVHAQTIRRISEQSNGIATNIAIEAAGAGRYEPEFRTVANTMKRYIADLRAMVDDSERATKHVLEAHERLNARKAMH